jgi:four helix bundle protein
MNYFDHEKFVVYQTSIEFVSLTNNIIEQLPKGKAYLADQLQRAASSISLNIAEGAGEFSKNEKARFYRMAKRSTTECAAILDICTKLQLIDQSNQVKARELLIRIVAMLTKLVKHTASP